MTNLINVLQYIKNYKKEAISNILLNILSVIFSLVSLLMVIPFLRILFDKTPLVYNKPEFTPSTDWISNYFNYFVSQIIINYGKMNALLFICIVVFTVFFLKNFFKFSASYYMATIRNGVVRDIRNNVFKKITELPLSYYSDERKGDILMKVTNDVQEVEWGIMSVLEAAFREPLTIASYLFAMLIISPTLTLFVFIVLPITGIIIARIGKTLKKQSHQAQERLGSIMSIIDETLGGIRIVKGFNAEALQNKKFNAQNEAHFSIMRSILRRKDLSSPLSEFLSVSVIILVLYVGGRMVLNNSLSLSAETFIGFMVIFSQIIPPAKQFSAAYYHIQKGIASFERIKQILQTNNTICDPENPVILTEFKTAISYKNVSFEYENNTPVLKNINIEIPKGKVLALVGESGAGKSTIADLLPRFYDVTSGSIEIDGINIKQYKLESIRNLMGMVTQEPILFNDTIFNNIAFGLSEQKPTLDQVMNAAKVANAHDFIMQLENTYETNIGDRGCKLSGGERQRLTIARAVLKNPPILILDEATSSLDSASERLVRDALYKLMQNRTSIIIAHRLSTVQYADQIIVLKNGEIIEKGTHNELMQNKGNYKQLADLQSF